MKLILGSLFMVFMIYKPSIAVYKIHNCFPSSFTGICILGHVFYNRSHDIKHIFPQNYTLFRIGNDGWSKAINSVIREFDGQLHAELGHPPAVEILDSEVEMLEIPRTLRHANFADNRLKEFWIEKGETEPLLSYLDLGQNRISNLTNITVFVNLETIYLYNNRLEALELNVFKNFTKLKILNVNYNQIAALSGDYFPPTLTYLGLYYNELTTLNYSALQLPSLETLNLERNSLATIDVARLLLGLPKLQLLRLGHNHFSQETLLTALDVLKQHHVNYRDESEEVSCYYDSEEIEGVCMGKQVLGRGWFKAVVLSIITILMAIGFVLMVRWVFITMNK